MKNLSDTFANTNLKNLDNQEMSKINGGSWVGGPGL